MGSNIQTEEPSLVPATSQNPAHLLISGLGWGWIFVVISILVAGYYGYHLSEALSFKIPDGWCPENQSVLGQHCFGDFGHPFFKGGEPRVYQAGNVVAVNSPLILLFFEVLRLLPYRWGLMTFMLLGIASMLAPCGWAVRHWPRQYRPMVYFVIGVGTFGFITAFDRANPIIFLPGLILLVIVSVEKERWTAAALLVALASAVKFWAPVLIIPLLLNRRYGKVLLAAGTAALLHLVPLLYFPGNYFSKLKISLDQIFSEGNSNFFQPYVISISGLARRVTCALRDQGTCNTLITRWGFEATPLFTGIVAVLLFCWAAWCYTRYPRRSVMRYAPTIALGAIALPTAQSYNSVLFIVVAALVLRWHGPGEIAPAVAIPRTLVPALWVCLLPIAIYSTSNSLLSSTNGSGPVFRLNYWLIPLVWTAVVLETLRTATRRKSKELVSTSTSEL